MISCTVCGSPVLRLGSRGTIPRHCSNACRQKAFRKRQKFGLPGVMTDRVAWVRADGKRPITIDGLSASSTNAATWDTFESVTASKLGDGFGIMLGAGLGCWDLDHCLTSDGLADWAREILDSIDSPLWVERSMSGTGLHIFVDAAPAPGRKGNGVEFYSQHRFIRVTADRFEG